MCIYIQVIYIYTYLYCVYFLRKHNQRLGCLMLPRIFLLHKAACLKNINSHISQWSSYPNLQCLKTQRMPKLVVLWLWVSVLTGSDQRWD